MSELSVEKDAHGWDHPIRHPDGGVTYLPPLEWAEGDRDAG